MRHLAFALKLNDTRGSLVSYAAKKLYNTPLDGCLRQLVKFNCCYTVRDYS